MHAIAETFQKRTYSINGYLADLCRIMNSFLNSPARRDESSSVDPAFAERIMLAVTQVNDCRYCNYAHSAAALRAGVTQDELEAIRSGDFSSVSDQELPALLFAQHYADSGGSPNDEALETLLDSYGEGKSARILLIIRMITLGNLLGNTFDALLNRVRGRKVINSSALEELAVLVLVVLTTPLMLLAGVTGAVLRLVRRTSPC
jgi:AhpD family alkylhydroperoxidase